MRDKQKLLVRSMLIQAGMKLFESQSFVKTTVDQITNAAGVGKGTFRLKIYEVTVKRTINAAHSQVYNIVIDLEEHRRILPKQFESLDVLRGGNGAGTVFRLNMNVMGNRSSLEMTITEPEPGRIVQERDETVGVTTIWELTPIKGSDRCLIELTSEFPSKPGIAGTLERLITKPVIRSIYRQELDNINEYVTKGIVSRGR